MGIIDPTQKEIIEEQKAYLKGKSLKYKLSYYAQYYLAGTIAAVIILVVLIMLIKTYIDNKPNALYAVYLNSINTPEVEEFIDYAGIDTSKNQVTYDETISINVDTADQNSYVGVQKLFAIITAKEGDVMLGDFKTMCSYASSSFYMDLRDIYSEAELEALGDRVVWDWIYDDEGNPTSEKAPQYIDISDSKVLYDNLCYAHKELLISFFGNTERIEMGKTFVDYLLKETVEID